MELTYDWRSFQSVFSPRRRENIQEGVEPTGPIYLVAEKDVIVTPFANNEDLSEWVGLTVREMANELGHRDLVIFEREKVDQVLSEAAGLSHSYEQADYLMERAHPTLITRGHVRKLAKGMKATSLFPSAPKHFLLESIHGWWGKVLPSSYGVFLRLEGPAGASPISSTGAGFAHGPCRDFFVVIRRGKLDAFFEPDLSSMGVDRCRQPADAVKYLSEKYLVPVQGVFVTASEWREWGESNHPWRKVALSIRANRAKLVPFRWGLVTLMASRAFLEI